MVGGGILNNINKFIIMFYLKSKTGTKDVQERIAKSVFESLLILIFIHFDNYFWVLRVKQMLKIP